MNKLILLSSLLIVWTINLNAQIPNNGFEDWMSFGNYEDPSFWGSTNSSSSGQFYAITKSTDHYPNSTGQFSVRLENNTSYNPNNFARGFLATGPPPPGPDFAIVGHPNSLTGYYKFMPQNGDSMLVQIQLYDNGNSVAFASFISTDTVNQWTLFNLDISNYASADSASIIIAAYYANGFQYLPHGNSILYIDNLSFDNPITGLFSPKVDENSLTLYPNPANNFVSVDAKNKNQGNLEVRVFNTLGQIIKSENLQQNQQEINILDLEIGTYFIEIKCGEWSEKQKFMIQR